MASIRPPPSITVSDKEESMSSSGSKIGMGINSPSKSPSSSYSNSFNSSGSSKDIAYKTQSKPSRYERIFQMGLLSSASGM